MAAFKRTITFKRKKWSSRRRPSIVSKSKVNLTLASNTVENREFGLSALAKHISDVIVFHLVEPITYSFVVAIFAEFCHMWASIALRYQCDSEALTALGFNCSMPHPSYTWVYSVTSEGVQTSN